MNRYETINLLKNIRGVYGRHFVINEHTVENWEYYLAKYNYYDIEKKLDSHVRTKRYPPIIGHLLL